MIPLTADTRKLLYEAKSDAVITVFSDSTTVTRISKDGSALDDAASTGWGLIAGQPLRIRMKAKEQLFGISTGTPNLTVLPETSDCQVVR